jgi:two-component system nitrate/nitrite response regulator NarL
MIRVLIVNEIQLMCNIIASVLGDEPDIEVAGCVTTVEAALDRAQKEDVDVVLISTRLPEQGALHLTRSLTASVPVVNVLVLGLTERINEVLQYVEAGAIGYVLKNDSVDDLLTAIRAADKGKAKVSPEIAAALMQRLTELSQQFASLRPNPIENANLTPREFEILELLGQNLSNQEIADRLYIEIGTVKNHVHNLLNKLEVSSREEAATYLAFIKK